MNRKFIFVILSIALFGLLAACSGGSDDEGSKDETFSIDYSTWANPGEPAYEGMVKFKDVVEEKTDGNVTVELFPGNQLGSTEEQEEQLKIGTIQMMSSGNPGLEEIEYLSLPYLMKSNEHWQKVLDSELGQEWNQRLIEEMNILNIGTLPRGPRVISSSKEVNSIADLSGFKIRSPERDYYVQTFEAMGANPTPMDFGEVYNGLQTGIVDGQENPLETFYSAGYQEVQKYIINTNHMYKPAFVNINNDFFESLPEEYQNIILEAAEESHQHAAKLLEESEQEMIDELEESGIIFIDPNLDEYIEATQSVRDNIGREVWGDEVYEQIVEIGQSDL